MDGAWITLQSPSLYMPSKALHPWASWNHRHLWTQFHSHLMMKIKHLTHSNVEWCISTLVSRQCRFFPHHQCAPATRFPNRCSSLLSIPSQTSNHRGWVCPYLNLNTDTHKLIIFFHSNLAWRYKFATIKPWARGSVAMPPYPQETYKIHRKRSRVRAIPPSRNKVPFVDKYMCILSSVHCALISLNHLHSEDHAIQGHCSYSYPFKLFCSGKVCPSRWQWQFTSMLGRLQDTPGYLMELCCHNFRMHLDICAPKCPWS